MTMNMNLKELDPEDKQKRINEIMKYSKEEIATQWVTLGSDMKQKYDKLNMEFIEYKMANDLSRFFEVVKSEKSNEILGSKIRDAIQGNVLYIDWLKKSESKSRNKNSSKSIKEDK